MLQVYTSNSRQRQVPAVVTTRQLSLISNMSLYFCRDHTPILKCIVASIGRWKAHHVGEARLEEERREIAHPRSASTIGEHYQ
jgi:hypothetical protein